MRKPPNKVLSLLERTNRFDLLFLTELITNTSYHYKTRKQELVKELSDYLEPESKKVTHYAYVNANRVTGLMRRTDPRPLAQLRIRDDLETMLLVKRRDDYDKLLRVTMSHERIPLRVNELHQVPLSARYVTELRVLDLSKTMITELPEHVFNFLPNLLYLNLDHTSINKLNLSRKPPRLCYLSLIGTPLRVEELQREYAKELKGVLINY